MKKLIMIPAVLIFFITACGSEKKGAVENREGKVVTASGYGKATKNGINIKWKVRGKNIEVTVKAPTEGWVAAGFGAKHSMKAANIIIGYVKDGKAVIRDDWGDSPRSHRADVEVGGKDNIIEKAGKEKNGVTEISFVIPLNSGDIKDKVLVPGEKVEILLAYGRKDNFKTYHKARTHFETEL